MFLQKQRGQVLLGFILVIALVVAAIWIGNAVADSTRLANLCKSGDIAACVAHQAKYAWLGMSATPTPVGAPCPECADWHP